ncbi:MULTISPECIES: M48 family metallopeptidase [unclassified Legionella]|uniref:M48 family metallopeptidase n=1 Tax=unclassified Legionella TaxID=2622702 RepID=UPI00105424CA|nr:MULTISPECIES: SprT family zinc-dependent metalloprotease [unclassified Legionella]MDI9819342.1 SprT family zinc-dependent metalloprotease [Legionella sp. PL877]
MPADIPYITFGDDKIPFELQAKKRQSRRITIKVKADCRVVVSAPPSAARDEIIVAVNKRARWVHNKLQWFKNQQEVISPRQYISGESHYYLGKEYILKVIDEPDMTPQVKLSDDYLQVISPREKKNSQQLLSSWYREKADEIFNCRLALLLPETTWVRVYPDIRLRAMRSRWGSCSAKGKITLNTHLIKAPLACIDYVILHELCHIAEHNHSHKFYRLLDKVSPDWRQAKSYLDKTASLYLTV